MSILIPHRAITVSVLPAPAFAHEAESAVGRPRSYLASARGQVGDDHAFRLLGLFWTGAARAELARATRDLVAQQRAERAGRAPGAVKTLP